MCSVKLILSIGIAFVFAHTLPAQQRVRIDSIDPQGAWARMEVTLGDTVFVMTLRPVRITEKRTFKDYKERHQYYLYSRASKKVYPYAVEALEIYEEWAKETEGLKRRKQRKYAKQQQKELEEQFEAKLKKFTKTEGKVLIKMLERETGKSFHTLIKETRGGVTATYWYNLSSIWGYDLKDGYKVGADPLLDEVLIDYDFGNPLRY